MNRILAAAVIAFAGASPASADDFSAKCVAEVETWPGEQQAGGVEGCSCIVEAMAADAGLDAEMRKLQTMAAEDREAAMSEKAGEAIGACFG